MRKPAVAHLLGLLLVCLLAAGCAGAVNGSPHGRLVPNATLPVKGSTGTSFDQVVVNAISDVEAFWHANYSKVSGGKSFPKIKGGYYSVNGAQVFRTHKAPAAVRSEACLAKQPTFVIDNAAYCTLDDSVVWDRSPGHLLQALNQRYGSTLVALVFAHEFGHAVQARLGITKRHLPTIDTESQADCAAGAFMASALAGKAPHFPVDASELYTALNGFLLVRDTTPLSPKDISHGNGFDRLTALQDGIQHGVAYCYRPAYFNRHFTERPYVSRADYLQGGNERLSEVLNSKAGGLKPSLNQFWTKTGTRVHKTFQNVSIAEASRPKCGAADAESEFGYCPSNNIVYYNQSYATQAYYSLPALSVNPHTARVQVVEHQPADFALGTLFAIGWGFAARHQFFSASTKDQGGLLAAICYTGSYAKSINVAHPTAGTFSLSPPDMDEASYAILNLVGEPQAYGDRGTTGLQRVRAFVTGYFGDLSSC